MPTPEQLQALVAQGQLQPDVADRLGAMPPVVAPSGPPMPEIAGMTQQQIAGIPMQQQVVAPSSPQSRPPGFSGWIREGLQAYGLGLAAMDPIRELERIDERKAMAEAERDQAVKDARLASGGYEVIMEQGGAMPGQMVGDKDGRVYWVPAYGPAAVEPIEVASGEDPQEVMQFAVGPQPDREMMMAALAGKGQ